MSPDTSWLMGYLCMPCYHSKTRELPRYRTVYKATRPFFTGLSLGLGGKAVTNKKPSTFQSYALALKEKMELCFL